MLRSAAHRKTPAAPMSNLYTIHTSLIDLFSVHHTFRSQNMLYAIFGMVSKPPRSIESRDIWSGFKSCSLTPSISRQDLETQYLAATQLDSDEEGDSDGTTVGEEDSDKLNLTFTMSDLKRVRDIPVCFQRVRESLERSTEVISSDSDVSIEEDLEDYPGLSNPDLISFIYPDSFEEVEEIEEVEEDEEDNIQPPIERVASTDYFVLEFKAPPKRSVSASPMTATAGRPISSQQPFTKSAPNTALTETRQDKIVIDKCLVAALAQENRSHSRNENDNKPRPPAQTSVPAQPQKKSKPPKASESLTQETLEIVSQKVKDMSAREQRRLLRVLDRLDTATPIMSTIGALRTSDSSTESKGELIM
eukprot:sb/3465992/